MNIKNSVKPAVLAAMVAVSGCGGGGSSSSYDASVSVQDAGPPEISWYSAAQPLVQRYCTSCHTQDSPLAPFPLETYQQVYNKLSAMTYVLEADTMPPLGFADLGTAEADILAQWLAAGAPKGDPSQAPLPSVSGGYTYHGDARAILEKYCVTCHVDGGVAPFPLDSYDKVKAVAAAAAFAVDSGDMPPWPPTPGFSRFTHERVLEPQEEFALLNWLNSGNLPEGNPQDYEPPQMPEPDAIDYDLRMPLPQPYTPTLRPDDHRCFAIEWPYDELTYVTAVDVIPDQVAEVHHVIVNVVEPAWAGTYRAASGQDGNPGWPCLLSGGLPGTPLPRQLGGWVPGSPAGAVPEGTGMAVEPGSLIVVQMHYNTLVAEPTPDQSTVLIATTDEVERPANGFLFTNPGWLRSGGMPIPAGDPNVHHSFEVPAGVLATLFGDAAQVAPGEPWVIHNGFLHMHYLATTGRTTLIRADGTEQVILDIRDWDFNWQSTYRLEQELLVNPDDRIRLECTWDNTDANQVIINGVQKPARDVEWGDGTGDEMCLMNIYMTRPKPGHHYSYKASVHIEEPGYRQAFRAGDLVPLKFLFNNFSLAEPGSHGGHDHAMDHGEDMHGGDHSAVHVGHYHVYLDTDDDNAEHLTAWDAGYYYQLPEDIEPGLHTLRVSLRGDDHHALGVEDEVTIEVVQGDPAQVESLIDVNAWTFQSAAQDSLAAHRPATVECPDNSWYNEDGALEVETGFCNYLSVAQPSLADIDSGDTLHLVLWHGNLAFPQPASAHVAISIDGNIVWQRDVAIPADAEIFDVRVPVNVSAPAGSKIEYHLHNHGYNTWTLLDLAVER
ncbi:MAG: hypothetical protein CME59_15745 [Halioglobus sp.]|nr:hypothetical protein [Halioglobus sp.]